MWSALKSDLLDFVTTITEDTSKAISTVIGDREEHEEEEDGRAKLILDARRSFGTYHKPVEEVYTKEYEKFFKTFSLTTYAGDISSILDQEVDVSRFYAELVPTEITPEIFWSRYFFKVHLINRNGAFELSEDDDNDEEEVGWESSVPVSEPPIQADPIQPSDRAEQDLSIENEKLRGQVRALVRRIAELEGINASKDETITALRKQLEKYTLVSENIASSTNTLDGLSDDSIVVVNEPDASLKVGESITKLAQSPTAKPAESRLPSEVIKKVVESLDDEEEDSWT